MLFDSCYVSFRTEAFNESIALTKEKLFKLFTWEIVRSHETKYETDAKTSLGRQIVQKNTLHKRDQTSYELLVVMENSCLFVVMIHII